MKPKLSTVLGIGVLLLIVMIVFVTTSGPLVGKVFSTINATLYTNERRAFDMDGAPPVEEPMATQAAEFAFAPEAPADADAPKDASGVESEDGFVEVSNTLPDVPSQQGSRMIIKNADVKLQVEDTDTAIDRSTQIVGDVGGYIISSRVWYQPYLGENYKYATISIGVPVDEFENAMRRLRTLALRVLDENASGQDVSAEFVDLESKLGNLEATRDRIRTFLEDAKTVEESLSINQELTNIDDQIEQVKGRMNFLSGRSAFSTITINLEPKLPDVEPTPTPTLRPTATPKVWNPGETVENAQTTITSAYQGIVDMLIWVLIVFIPLFAPPALIIWIIWKLTTRKGGKPASGG